jgi:curved DNA-binding protein CbpA
MSKEKIDKILTAENHYQTLGVDPDADAKAIKKAYKDLALITHPDKSSKDAQAEEAFKKLAIAYSILSDPQQKKAYDDPIAKNQQPQNETQTQLTAAGSTPPKADGSAASPDEAVTSSALVVSAGPTPTPSSSSDKAASLVDKYVSSVGDNLKNIGGKQGAGKDDKDAKSKDKKDPNLEMADEWMKVVMSVNNAITKAFLGSTLQEMWDDPKKAIKDIDKTVSENLSKIADVIKGVGDSIKNLFSPGDKPTWASDDQAPDAVTQSSTNSGSQTTTTSEPLAIKAPEPEVTTSAEPEAATAPQPKPESGDRGVAMDALPDTEHTDSHRETVSAYLDTSSTLSDSSRTPEPSRRDDSELEADTTRRLGTA